MKLAPFLLLSTLLSIRASNKKHFDIIIGGSGLTAPTLYLLSVFFRSKTMLFLHGLDLVVDSVIYKWTFLPCIRRVDQVIANSSNTKKIALDKGITESRITVINPGTDLPERPDELTLAKFRRGKNIGFKKVIIFVGRLTQRKGLSAFIRNSLDTILTTEPEAGLVVVGENPDNSLNKLGEQAEVHIELQRMEHKDRVRFLGHVSDTELLCCYTMADVQILPLVDVPGDIEGFGMIAVEAAACGTPTIAFNLGGVSDAISTDNGLLVEAGDYVAFQRAVMDSLQGKKPIPERCIDHANHFSWAAFDDKLNAVIRSIG
jgi:phosphatidylinositol alpha-1,6-mannosyltransferase